MSRCQATKPAVLLVTVHKFHGGIHSAVTLQDGCFGTTTVMRIASMFVPHNIFMVSCVWFRCCKVLPEARFIATMAIAVMLLR